MADLDAACDDCTAGLLTVAAVASGPTTKPPKTLIVSLSLSAADVSPHAVMALSPMKCTESSYKQYRRTAIIKVFMPVASIYRICVLVNLSQIEGHRLKIEATFQHARRYESVAARSSSHQSRIVSVKNDVISSGIFGLAGQQSSMFGI